MVLRAYFHYGVNATFCLEQGMDFFEAGLDSPLMELFDFPMFVVRMKRKVLGIYSLLIIPLTSPKMGHEELYLAVALSTSIKDLC